LKYLIRSSTDVICHCKCPEADALVAHPIGAQAGCPWCGCGWLWSCTVCRKSFTFAKVVDLPMPYADFVHDDALRWGMSADEVNGKRGGRLVAQGAEILKRFTAPLLVDREYVLLDQCAVLAYEPVIGLVGKVRVHDFPLPPQTVARKAGNEELELLLDSRYWAGEL
jgi:hypothetical protein